jgi:hypothetical protein
MDTGAQSIVKWHFNFAVAWNLKSIFIFLGVGGVGVAESGLTPLISKKK